MKLHRNLCEAVTGVLEEIFIENRYADKAIEKLLKQNPKWGARDRRFIAETTYDIVRWYRLLVYLSDADEKDFWKLLGAWCVWNEIRLPGWDEMEIDKKSFFQAYEHVKSDRKIRESIPDWLDTLGERELGSRWGDELHDLNEEAKVVLRVNTLKTSRQELQRQLADDD